jgi:MoxR-like ATPase
LGKREKILMGRREIGLPFISKKTYDGEDVSVTEYTMSEIIASIYDQIEQSGIHEGILFLDEINCVSETLAPTMLQFLQYKTFGNHRVFLILKSRMHNVDKF